MAAQINGEAIAAGVLHRIRGVVAKQIERLTGRNSSVERFIHGVVGRIANLCKVCLFYAVRAVAIRGNGRALDNIFRRVSTKCTASNANGSLRRIVDAGQIIGRRVIAACIEFAVDRTARNRYLCGLPSHAIVVGVHVAIDRAASNGCRAV